MKAKLETLSVSVLREFAKDKNIKNISTMRKSELIDAMQQKEKKRKSRQKLKMLFLKMPEQNMM